MPRIAQATLPRWLSSASVAWTGAALAVLVATLGGGFLLYEQRKIQERELQSAEMYARVLQDQAERIFDTVDIALSDLVDNVSVGLQPGATARLNQELTTAQQGMPFLRSLSAMDAKGRVLASSVAGNIDVVVDLDRILLPAGGATDRLGSLVHGRDLSDAAAGQVARGTGTVSRSFVPLVRVTSSASDAPVFLVATLNPDFFANTYALTLADPTRSAAMFSVDAVLLAATDNIRLVPGQSAAAHRFFRDFLPAHESGSFVGAGVDGAKVVTAFRMLRKRPIAVLVERDHASLAAQLAQTAAWVSGACGLALAVMGVLVVMAWRSLRSHEVVRAALSATRDHVAASERNLRTLVQSVHEWIFRADADGRVTYVNGRWQQITGRPDAAALGRRLADLCVDGDRQAIDALFSADRHGTADAIMVQIADARGEPRTLEVSIAAVVEEDGSTTGYAGFAVDVSERQLARHRLESQLAFTARLLDVSPTPLFVKDIDGRFTSVNRAWLDLMGFELDDVIGRTSTDLFGDDAPLHHARDQHLLQSGDRVSYENRLLRPGREGRDTIVTKVRFTQADGVPAGMVGSIIDVTEFRDAERRIRQARDAAELANSAKSEFLANISHELRTPLQAIIGFSELGGDLSADAPHFLEMFADIRVGGQRMLRLVNGLLDVAQMDSAVGSLALQRRDVAAQVEAVVNELRPESVSRGQRIEWTPPGTALAADLDASRFQQVVRNVLTNAMVFSPSGACIEVACVDHGAAGVEVSVRDHGCGVPEDELDAVFAAFVQSSRTRDGSGGTGLGLTIGRKIMSAHGGSITLSNAPGGGTLVRIALPAPHEAQGAIADAPSLLFASEVP